jgi:predicted DNA-binding transcriptional regulator AlpA
MQESFGLSVENLEILSKEKNVFEYELMGTAEVAEFFSVTSAAVSNWKKRGQMPKPVAELKMSPIWNKSDIEDYKQRGLLPVRKPQK